MPAVITPLHPAPSVPAQLSEPSLFYAPPYGSPADDEFAWHLVKVLDGDCGVMAQVPIQTPAGPVWVDFVVETMLPDGRMRRVGFELTGADEDGEHAALRDALLAGTHALDALYRFRASDVLTRVADVLLLVSGWEPALFSLRGRTNLERLASPDALLTIVHPNQAEVLMETSAVSSGSDDAFADVPVAAEPLRLVRRSAVHPATWQADYARAAEAFAVAPLRRAA